MYKKSDNIIKLCFGSPSCHYLVFALTFHLICIYCPGFFHSNCVLNLHFLLAKFQFSYHPSLPTLYTKIYPLYTFSAFIMLKCRKMFDTRRRQNVAWGWQDSYSALSI